MSHTTATLNRLGRKRQALAELRRGLAPGCSLTLMGDGWTLRRRTGRQDVFADVEQLLDSLDSPEAGTSADWTGAETPRALVRRLLTRAR
ncbi:hypothetical protein [Citricoccus sp. K5]|uniref:hypothetical protein n=1 Tax=Citricoccus sp. K5 TaxID=2653135 RepID=UPI001F48BCD0|nr:hypothetical protein [Citricoccus sp. K5]